MKREERALIISNSKRDRRNVFGPANCLLRDVAWNGARVSSNVFSSGNAQSKDVALAIEEW